MNIRFSRLCERAAPWTSMVQPGIRFAALQKANSLEARRDACAMELCARFEKLFCYKSSRKYEFRILDFRASRCVSAVTILFWHCDTWHNSSENHTNLCLECLSIARTQTSSLFRECTRFKPRQYPDLNRKFWSFIKRRNSEHQTSPSQKSLLAGSSASRSSYNQI